MPIVDWKGCPFPALARSILLLLMASVPQTAAAQASDEGLAAIEANLQSRLESRPDDASSWRLLGKVRLKRGRPAAAREALERALELDPHNAAAHFDFGGLLLLFEEGHAEAAARHFRRVVDLAPDSEYAAEAREHLSRLPALPDDSAIVQAGYDIQRFDGSDLAERFTPDDSWMTGWLRPISLRLETGVLYNSNVALTPISRELAPGNRGGFQAFAAPALEYRMLDGERWRSGPTFLGYFSLNQPDFSPLNVQSYQPGLFVENTIVGDFGVLVPRLQYDFNHDAFAGQTFGNRHALTASATTFWNGGDSTFLYWTTDYTNFADEGIFPTVTSRDGWMHSVGVSHRFDLGYRYLSSFRAGGDLQRADTVGSDFAFNGVMLFGETETPITDTFSVVLRGGWGYRDYHRFEFEPSRNEHIWRIGTELRQRLSENLVAAAVFNYDRFDSQNPLFAADRFLSGLVLMLEY